MVRRVCSGVSASTTSPSPAPDRPRPDSLREIAPYLSRWLATQVECRQVPGAQVAVRLGAELVLSEAFGVADLASGEPLRTDHVFRVASHSKTFTSVAVLQLVEAGRLRLDDTVGGLLPDHVRPARALEGRRRDGRVLEHQGDGDPRQGDCGARAPDPGRGGRPRGEQHGRNGVSKPDAHGECAVAVVCRRVAKDAMPRHRLRCVLKCSLGPSPS